MWGPQPDSWPCIALREMTCCKHFAAVLCCALCNVPAAHINLPPLPCFPPAGVDYYRTQLVVPKDAYELNFVFSNGDGLYDNNGTQVRG